MKHISIQETFERKIVHGLSCEWDNALWVLSPEHRASLKKPLFCLKNFKFQLGTWNAEKKEICLSRNLIYNHGWNIIRETLLHEMAHQFAEQVLGASGESPHGPSFQKACFFLRANPKASASFEFLEVQEKNYFQTDTDRTMIRVKKLMALAQSKNRHEAEAAMLKAHELIKKYNIDLLSANQKRNFKSIFLGSPALRHFREEYHLANLLQDFYFIQGIWISAYVIEKGKMGRVLEISGTSRNIQIAGYVHDFVRRFIESSWRHYSANRKLNRYRKTDFAVGIIEGFRSKLENENKTKKSIPDPFAIVKAEDPLLKKYMNYRYPQTINFGRNASHHDEHIFADGKRIGKKLILYKGISEKSISGKLLPE